MQTVFREGLELGSGCDCPGRVCSMRRGGLSTGHHETMETEEGPDGKGRNM